MNWNGLTPNSFWYDQHRLLFNKDCRSMADLLDESVQMVVTSPPYWGLRKYSGLPDLVWGGNEKCQHKWVDEHILAYKAESGVTTKWQHHSAHYPDEHPESYTNWSELKKGKALRGICSLCGAWKGAYGLEPTPEMYVQHTIEILREVRRVLRKDGVVFWNIGDSYFGGGHGYGSPITGKQATNIGTTDDELRELHYKSQNAKHPILKPKDLCLIPFRVAIAAQEDGWWVRSVIIWNKPNPMPESVTDRCSESHEYILHLTKSAKYYWDAEAVREPLTPAAVERYQYDTGFHKKGGRGELYGFPQKRGFKSKHGTTFEEQEQHHGQDINSYPNGRNLRSVWTFSTQSFAGAHFATYPEKLVEICVKAATPEVGCCSKCGKPWVRIIDSNNKTRTRKIGEGQDSAIGTAGRAGEIQTQTLGWQPQCKCDADKVPSIVLDPFAGSGTTLKVAAELNRRAIGYELSQPYCDLAVQRNRQAVMV